MECSKEAGMPPGNYGKGDVASIIPEQQSTWLQVWENCRTYNEPPHKVLDMCDRAEALVKAAWEREGVERLERIRPSKKRKAFSLNSDSRPSDLPEEMGPQSSEGLKRLKITIRSSQGRLATLVCPTPFLCATN